MLAKYMSNNSGGDWWLRDNDWKNLEAHGWAVDWESERRLGAMARGASKTFETPRDAILEFEKITEQDVSNNGCTCCGPPHRFYFDGVYNSGSDLLEYLFPKTWTLSPREMLQKLAELTER